MPLIASTTNNTTPSFAYSGSIWWAQDDWAVPEQLYLPLGVSALYARPSVEVYENRLYLVGGHDENLVVDESKRVHRQGILPPTQVPAVATTAGVVNLDCYLAFLDELTGERSTLSDVLTTTWNNAANRTWTNIPTRPPEEQLTMEGTVTMGGSSVTIPGTNTKFSRLRPGDKIALSNDPDRLATVVSVTSDTSLTTDITLGPVAGGTITISVPTRVSHIELWLGVDGAPPRLAVQRDIGVTTITEAVATLSLGLDFGDPFERFPRCSMNAIYHDRQLMAGDSNNKDVVYLSLPFFPERYSGVSFKTRDGNPVTALLTSNDTLVICTASTMFLFQGYLETDLVLEKHNAGLGAMSHHMTVDVHGNRWIGNKDGWWLYNGGMHNIIAKRRKEWHNAYRAERSSWEAGYAYKNPNERVVKIIPLPVGSSHIPWVADYTVATPEISGGLSQPRWTNDGIQLTEESYVISPTTGIGTMYYGDETGVIYKDDPAGGIGLPCKVVHKLYTFNDPGGDLEEGRTLQRLWVYMKSEDATQGQWELRVYGGDSIYHPETGALRTTNDFMKTIATSLRINEVDPAPPPPTITRDITAQTCHWFKTEVSGRGVTIDIRLGRGSVYSGLGGIWGPGPARRPAAEVQITE